MTNPITARMPSPTTFELAPPRRATNANATQATTPDWLKLDISDDAARRFRDEMNVADDLARGMEASKNAALNFEKEAARERLKLLKMLAEQAIAAGDARAAKRIAEEIGQIARRLGSATAAAGATAANPAGTGTDNATDNVTGTVGDQTPEAAQEVAAAEAATPASDVEAADRPAQAAEAPQVMVQGDSEVRDLLKFAKKILERLRHAFSNDREAMKKIEEAGRRINVAAADAGVSLADQPDEDRGGTEVSITMTITTTVEVTEVSASLNIKV